MQTQIVRQTGTTSSKRTDRHTVRRVNTEGQAGRQTDKQAGRWADSSTGREMTAVECLFQSKRALSRDCHLCVLGEAGVLRPRHPSHHRCPLPSKTSPVIDGQRFLWPVWHPRHWSQQPQRAPSAWLPPPPAGQGQAGWGREAHDAAQQSKPPSRQLALGAVVENTGHLPG